MGHRRWTPTERDILADAYKKDVRENGKVGVYARLAKKWLRTPKTIKQALYRHPDWPFPPPNAIEQLEKDMAADIEETDYEENVPATQFRALEQRLTIAQDEARQAKAKVRKSDRMAGIVGELAVTLEQSMRPMDCPVIPTAAPIEEGQEDVDAVVMLSDQHSDRLVTSEGTWGLEQYDFDAFRCRLWEWAKTIKGYLTHHLPKYKVDTLWVWHLGDAVNGDIHNMKLRNQWQNSLQAAIACGDAQAEALAYLADVVRRIVQVNVSGNHGRTTTQIEYEDPWDNFDYLVARTMQLRLAGTPLADRVQIEIPRAWSAHVEVRGHLWHLNHGHGVTGTWGVPWYGFERREGRVQRLVGLQGRQVEYYAYGHYHQAMTRPAGAGKAIHAGAWYLTDPYALNKLSVGNEPEQQLLIFSERFGRQIEVPLFVRDQEREAAMRRGEYDPPFGRGAIVERLPAGPVGGMPIITGG